jgi:hypothetical protein
VSAGSDPPSGAGQGGAGASDRLLPGSQRLPYPGDDLFWALFHDERARQTPRA